MLQDLGTNDEKGMVLAGGRRGSAAGGSPFWERGRIQSGNQLVVRKRGWEGAEVKEREGIRARNTRTGEQFQKSAF